MKPLPIIEALLPYAALCFCASLLVVYRLKRKFAKDRATGKLAFFDHNVVELLIALMYLAIAAPGWLGFLTDLVE